MIDGTLLRKLRQEKKLSATQLALKMNTSTSTVYRWEKQDALYDLDTILKLADFYNVSVEFLLNRENANKIEVASSEHENADEKKPIHRWLTYLYIVSTTAINFLIVSLLIVFLNHFQPTVGDKGYDLLIFVCLTVFSFAAVITTKLLFSRSRKKHSK